MTSEGERGLTASYKVPTLHPISFLLVAVLIRLGCELTGLLSLVLGLWMRGGVSGPGYAQAACSADTGEISAITVKGVGYLRLVISLGRWCGMGRGYEMTKGLRN